MKKINFKIVISFLYVLSLLLAFSVVWISFFPSLEKVTRFGNPVFKVDPSIAPVAVAEGFSTVFLLFTLKLIFKKTFSLTKVSLLWALFLIWTLISALLSGAGLYSSLWWSLDALIIVTGVIFGILSNESGAESSALLFSLLVALAVCGVLLWFESEGGLFARKAFITPFGNFTASGAFFSLCLLIALFLSTEEKSSPLIALFIPFFAFGGGWGRNGSVVLPLVIMLFFLSVHAKRTSSVKKFALLLATTFIFFSAGWTISSKLFPSKVEPSKKVLLEMWEKALEKNQYRVMGEDPLFGSGPGLYASRAPEAISSELKRLSFLLSKPLNDLTPPTLSALKGGEGGLPGFVLLLLPLFLLFLRAIQNRNFHTASLSIGLLSFAFFTSGSAEMKVWALFALAGGIALARWDETVSLSTSSLSGVLYTLAVLSVGISTGAGWREVYSRINLERAIKVEAVKRGGELPGIVKAWEINPFSVKTNFHLASVMYRYEGWDRALKMSERVLELFPGHLPALQILAGSEKRLMNTSADKEKFRERYIQHAERLVKLNPYAVVPAVEFLQFLLKEGMKEKALEVFTHILKNNPEFEKVAENNPDLRELLGQVH